MKKKDLIIYGAIVGTMVAFIVMYNKDKKLKNFDIDNGWKCSGVEE